ncbi:MAG: hypothetical protein M0P71_06235 [Melioribacteraceae bacterium]|nr:hypothetical protein [Melioribacteraceae bacterium]
MSNKNKNNQSNKESKIKTYKYTFFQIFLYRYGNIIATLFLVFHFFTSAIMMFQKWYFGVLFILNMFLIFILNKHFLKTYKYFPFLIKADDTKLICSNFFLSTKMIEIRYDEILELKGGIFSGHITKPIYVVAKGNKEIGFYSHAGNFNKLLTQILQYIPQDLYNNSLNKIEEMKKGTKSRLK